MLAGGRWRQRVRAVGVSGRHGLFVDLGVVGVETLSHYVLGWAALLASATKATCHWSQPPRQRVAFELVRT